jgi:hypothetical protein
MQNSMLGFGNFLLLMVDRLSDESATQDDVIDCLQQINETFARELDPAVEFEAYAALRLCQAILRVSERF